MRLTVRAESFPVAGVFAISRGSRREARVLTVTLERDGITGRGECVPYARYGESMESVEAQILSAEAAIAGGCDRLGLLAELPAGAARNALDCALWDWHAKAAGRRVWELAGLPEPEPVVTAYTLSLDAPDAMRAKAAENAWRPLLKIKLGGGADLDRLRAVREGAPDARLIVDANEGWTPEAYLALLPALEAAGVALIEQPFPAGEDAALDSLPRPIPVCADESCHDRASLAALKGRYDMVNIKLDKTGGLTEALALAEAARAAGFGIMVGCMLGSSLAMAPAHLLAQGAAVVDLDAPLLLAADRDPPVRYAGARMHPPEAALWG
ncbi:MAG: dipeptide epimerase [Paracoccaceae bacterium]|nr:MAG: dipeptide epimerase [Paracoccaceae bacterium]